MFQKKRSTIVHSVIVSLVFSTALAAAPAGAADPGVTCAVAKQKAAAKMLSDKLKCHAVALKKEEVVSPDCLTAAETKFGGAFAKAEGKGGCATTNDAATVEPLIDQTLASLIAALPVSSTSVCETVYLEDCEECVDCTIRVGGECLTQYYACSNDDACSAFLGCYLLCSTEDCRDVCQENNAAGSALYFGYQRCVATQCDSPCGPLCGDGVCDAEEAATSSCHLDCGCASICGDGNCDTGCEDPASCVSDCQIPDNCGDGLLGGGELCDGAAGSCPEGFQCNHQCDCSTPSAWTCSPNLYWEDRWDPPSCDCGCGVLDPDCTDASVASCAQCNQEGSCNGLGLGCPGDIDPANNAQCVP